MMSWYRENERGNSTAVSSEDRVRFVVLWRYEGCKWTDVLSGRDRHSYPQESVVGE